MNGNLKKYIGDYYHINNSWEVPKKPNEDIKKRTCPTHLHLDESNNLFVDVETVQRSMVKMYAITPEGIIHCSLYFDAPSRLYSPKPSL